MSGMVECAAASGGPRSFYRLGAAGPAPQHSVDRLQQSLFDSALGPGTAFGVAHSGANGKTDAARLEADVRASDPSTGDLRGPGSVPGYLLSGGKLAGGWGDYRTR